MTEYIVNVEDMVPSYFAHFNEEPETVFGHRLREKITRCHDCKYCKPFESLYVVGFKCTRVPTPFEVKFDDFCKRGEPRENNWEGR